MSYSPKEKRVLKKLGIKDFRYMTKDKIVQFASMLPQMNPEVAKAALSQFPDFVDLAKSMIGELRWMNDKNMNLANNSQDHFYQVCNSILETLKLELEKDNLTPEDRNKVIDQMIQVADMLNKKDSEVKRLAKHAQDGLMVMAGLALVAGAAILGAVATAFLPENDDSQTSLDSKLENDLIEDPNVIEGEFEDTEESLL